MVKQPSERARRRSNLRRQGATVLELLVAAVLLIALISIVAPLTVRAGRLWQESRTYRLAINELANELDRLSLLDDQARSAALSNWQLSPALAHALPDAKLTGETLDDEHGKRLKLSINWKRIGDPAPLTLIGWIVPPAEKKTH